MTLSSDQVPKDPPRADRLASLSFVEDRVPPILILRGTPNRRADDEKNPHNPPTPHRRPRAPQSRRTPR